MARPTLQSFACAKRILCWLQQHRTLGITFGAPSIRTVDDVIACGDTPPMHEKVNYNLTACCDADLSSVAMHPGAEPRLPCASRSQLGWVISFMGGPIDFGSRRQHSVALDTAASEIMAASVCGARLLSINGVVRFITFGALGDKHVPLYCDNDVCVLVSEDATSVKRLSYVARRARFLQELRIHGHVVMRRVKGTENPADAFTKHLKDKKVFYGYMARIYNVPLSRFA
jgi:hypothetical protein